MYNPVRGGNRGGKDQFKWDDIRLLPYKERECYLGATAVIGFLDKGGRWRKRDWWTKTNGGQHDTEEMRRELKRVQEDDERRMREALGLAPKRAADKPQLSEFEINELTRKGEGHADEDDADRIRGLGFETSGRQGKGNNGRESEKYSKLEGVGIKYDESATGKKAPDDGKQNDDHDVNHLEDNSKKIKKHKDKSEKKAKKEKKEKEKKKHKKEKKEKKSKKEKKEKKEKKSKKESRRHDSDSD